jgi:DNA polymerase
VGVRRDGSPSRGADVNAEPTAADLAALAWQLELGADEAIGEEPVNRFELAVMPPAAAPAAVDPEAGAAGLAAACGDLAALRAAIAGFEGGALKKGARNLVFADGDPRARVMVVGEAPGRDEDLAGVPFAGPAGRLLDRMLAAIGLSRHAEDPATAVYVTSVLPWRPQTREPPAAELALMLPFLFRHIELARPEVLVPMGDAARAVLDTEAAIGRLRGRWTEWRGLPVLPMLHPAYLLDHPEAKREAWADLLALRARLDHG